jgi:hypothetical protein
MIDDGVIQGSLLKLNEKVRCHDMKGALQQSQKPDIIKKSQRMFDIMGVLCDGARPATIPVPHSR